MSENFNKDISELKDLGKNGIDMDQWGEDDNTEMAQVSDILTKIKKSADSGTLQMDQLQKVISFLDRQMSDNMSMPHWQALRGMKEDFVNLTEKYDSEKAAIIKDSKKIKAPVKPSLSSSTVSSSPANSVNTNEYNYSTADKPELSGSVEDIIFNEIDSGSSATIDAAIKKIKGMEVDIFNITSHLRVRDENGKQMWENPNKPLQLGEGSDIQPFYTGEYKKITYKGKERIFIQIDLGEGKTGYIAAKYINGELLKKIIKPEPTPIKPEPTPEVIEDKVIETIPNIKKYKEGLQHDNLKEGVRIEVSDKELEKLTKNYPSVSIIKDIADVWMDAATKEASSEMFEMFKFGKTDREALTEQVQKVGSAIGVLLEKTSNLESISYSEITDIFKLMQKAENAETVISNLDEVKTKLGFVTSSNIEEKRLQILDLMRVKKLGISEGNSAMVTSKLGDMLLKDIDFKDIRNIVKDPNTYSLIDTQDLNGLKALGIPEDLAENLIEKYGEIERLQDKNKSIYIDAVKRENPGITDATVIGRLTKEKIKLSVNYSIEDLLKNGLLFNKLDNNDSLVEKNELNKTYSDTVGVGTFTFSDENVANSVELGLILATSLIPLGAGLKAASWAGRAVEGAYEGSKLAQIAAKGGRLGEAISLTKSASVITAEGLAFYETSNILHNAMFKEHYTNILDGATNGTEIAKSIAFFGVMKGFSKVAEFKNVQKLTDKVPKGVLKNTGALLVEAGVLTVAGVEIERQFSPENDVHYTWESYIEALMMVYLMKKISGNKPIEEPTGPKPPEPTGPKGEKPLKLEDIISTFKPSKEFPNFSVDKYGRHWIQKGDRWILKTPRGLKNKGKDVIEVGIKKDTHDYKWTAEKPGTKAPIKAEIKETGTKTYETVYENRNITKLFSGERGLFSKAKVGKTISLKDGINVIKTKSGTIKSESQFEISVNGKAQKFNNQKELESYLIKTRKQYPEAKQRGLIRTAPEQVKVQREVIKTEPKIEKIVKFEKKYRLHEGEAGLLRGSANKNNPSNLNVVGKKSTLKDGITVERIRAGKTDKNGIYKIENGINSKTFKDFPSLEKYLVKTRLNSGKTDLIKTTTPTKVEATHINEKGTQYHINGKKIINMTTGKPVKNKPSKIKEI